MTYHYVESGLDNIWLENGYRIHQTPYGEGVSIQDTEGLHKAIGNWLIAMPKRITGAELRFIRLEMELTQRSLAAILAAEEQAVRRWEKARTREISGPADRLLRALFDQYLNGNGDLRASVDRLAELDQIDHAKGRFIESDKGWVAAECLAA